MKKMIQEFILELGVALKTTAIKIIDSRKASALIASIVLMIIVYVFGPLPEEMMIDLADKIMKVVMAYLGAQGIADMGKEKAKVEKAEAEKE